MNDDEILEIQNQLEEFWSMVDFLNPNILGKYSYFKKVS